MLILTSSAKKRIYMEETMAMIKRCKTFETTPSIIMALRLRLYL
jgi:hypothetical protein